MARKPCLPCPLQIVGQGVAAQGDQEHAFQGLIGPEGARDLRHWSSSE